MLTRVSNPKDIQDRTAGLIHINLGLRIGPTSNPFSLDSFSNPFSLGVYMKPPLKKQDKRIREVSEHMLFLANQMWDGQ